MMHPSLLHLMHLVSPALPVGAYAYSQGLEYAIDANWIRTQEDIEEWLLGVMSEGLGRLDLPVLLRCSAALKNNEHEKLYDWNAQLQAWRETHELLLEDQQLGMALYRLLASLLPDKTLPRFESDKPSFAITFALAGYYWQIPTTLLSQGFLYSWLENQVAAATKIVPLGQTQAQQLLLKLMPSIMSVCEKAETLDDEDLGVSLPGLAIASALHERQYSRLFRS